MMIGRCWRLRPRLASYVDNELPETQRLVVEDHLGRCPACSNRVNRQRAVRDLLHDRFGQAHVSDAAWSPRPEQPSRSARWPGRLSLVAATGLAVGLVVWGPWRDAPLAARGHIRDSTCGGGHVHTAPELQRMAGRDCVRLCVELGARYVFVTDETTFPIRNQGFAELPRFAEQDVEVEGRLRGHRLTILQIRPHTNVARHEGRAPAIAVGVHP
jgi:hypothetical protein